jgi:hypothetical protein
MAMLCKEGLQTVITEKLCTLRRPVYPQNIPIKEVSGTIIRGTLKTPKSQLVTPISTKL